MLAAWSQLVARAHPDKSSHLQEVSVDKVITNTWSPRTTTPSERSTCLGRRQPFLGRPVHLSALLKAPNLKFGCVALRTLTVLLSSTLARPVCQRRRDAILGSSGPGRHTLRQVGHKARP